MNWQDYIQADAPAYLGINLLKEGYQIICIPWFRMIRYGNAVFTKLIAVS